MLRTYAREADRTGPRAAVASTPDRIAINIGDTSESGNFIKSPKRINRCISTCYKAAKPSRGKIKHPALQK